MGAKTALEMLRKELSALAQDGVTAPPIPADKFVAEARALAVTARGDRAPLLKAGLDKKLVDSLGNRADALAEAQAELQAVRGRLRSRTEIKLEADATELRSNIMAECRFALRGDPEKQTVLDRIADGSGLDDLVADLTALAKVIEGHQAELRAVGVNVKQRIASANAAATDLSAVIAERRGGMRDEADAINLRDRAATFLHAAVTEIRATGAFVFRNDPRKLAKYRSSYNATHRARRPATPAPAPVDA